MSPQQSHRGEVFWRVKRLEFAPGESDLKELKKARARTRASCAVSRLWQVLQVLQSFIKHAKQASSIPGPQ